MEKVHTVYCSVQPSVPSYKIFPHLIGRKICDILHRNYFHQHNLQIFFEEKVWPVSRTQCCYYPTLYNFMLPLRGTRMVRLLDLGLRDLAGKSKKRENSTTDALSALCWGMVKIIQTRYIYILLRHSNSLSLTLAVSHHVLFVYSIPQERRC